MKKYGSFDLVKKLYNTLCATDIIDNGVDAVEFKVSIDLVGHVHVDYDKHFIIVSPIECDGSTDYIIDDMTDDEHENYCDNIDDICTCVSTIVKHWFD